MTWEPLRKTNAASFTRAATSTPSYPQTSISQVPSSFSDVDNGLQWFFGFPCSLVTSLLRNYQWGDTFIPNLYPNQTFTYSTKPSTEQHYKGFHTRHPLPFVDLAQDSTTDSSAIVTHDIHVGITADGTLWSWGAIFDQYGSNALGTGLDADFPAGISQFASSSSLADGEEFHNPTKKIATTPQPIHGEGDELNGIVFTKAKVSGTTVVAMSQDGNLYCSGNGLSVFGVGDYYVTGQSGTSGQTFFSYHKLVRHWGISFQVVNGVLVGTPIQNAAKTWIDFALADGVLFGVTDGGKLYRIDTELHGAKQGSPYRLVLTNAGSGYSSSPTVTATASPTGDTMTLTASVSAGKVSLSVTSWGSGYTTLPTITISAPSSGTGATAEVQQLINSPWQAVAAGGYGLFAINDDSELFRLDPRANTISPKSTLNNRLVDGHEFVKVVVGDAFAVALDASGAVWTMGTANTGTGSAKTTLTVLDSGPWVDIAAGRTHGVMLNSDGEAWCWGKNNLGQLGDGTTTDRSTPVKVSGDAKWLKVFGGYERTMAIRDEQFDKYGNRVSPLAYTG